MTKFPLIENAYNPYRDNVQGKANEPITVAGLLDRSKQTLGQYYEGDAPDWTLEEIYDRLEKNAPRIAIIGGSSDHPAHIMDFQTSSRAAIRIWQNGGVPFYFSTPVMCDGTAQSNQGMSYSLQSRNAVAQMIVNQLEAHNYHAAFVIQGCDKQPLGVVSGLAHLDRLRQERGEAPFPATFAPAHVLQGGTIPDRLWNELEDIADRAKNQGFPDVADDLHDAMSYILQCSSNTSFQGVFERAVGHEVISEEEHKYFEKQLAVNTCDGQGGVCAFNGTGNSSRHIVAGFGLVHPSLELLTDAPSQPAINEAIDQFSVMLNKEEYGVSKLVAANIRNGIRIHSASGGSTNLMMHIVAAMLYGGYRFTLEDLDKLHHETPVPDLFNYSLTEDRDIYQLAMQCCDSSSRGMESLFYELLQNGVPMDVNALTVEGRTWAERLGNTTALSAENVKENRVILSKPKRAFSGVDVLRGNFFESAVVKISGMPTPHLDMFDKKVAQVLYFENEDEANKQLLNDNLIEDLKERNVFNRDHLLVQLRENYPESFSEWKDQSYSMIFDHMVEVDALKIAVVIAGQGPEAFGMPEMFTPMQHINTNRKMKRLATIISDGRYSGVTLGAAIGHMTPESHNDGGILYLQTGDLLYLSLREKRIDYMDAGHHKDLKISDDFSEVRKQRAALAETRRKSMSKRQKRIAASNRMPYHSDASKGVVPYVIMDEASDDYKPLLQKSALTSHEQHYVKK
ncbi:dihydroxy-acid dehydratase [Salicibibacter cibi]|uniref:Dihydroxy-acid dehydratase n=1 Tax=Salicibibacter cibi TaxID=2743001 RepID=A0A7T6Z8U7_9BACI|nr:dihydroxy-acid dehydratase [Salicibibacter cibi]QQK78837.1 dihydroxy-acid dehydratase [Salicibibacter cibi]